MALSDVQTEALNSDLKCLNELFPNASVAYLREVLLSSSEESRVYLVTQALLRHSRTDPKKICIGRRGMIRAWERFRSEEYRKACRSMLSKEFKGLSRSTIDAVMAENNFDFERSRTTLLGIASKSWRFSVSSWWFRRKRPDQYLDAFPKASGNLELDRELFNLGAKKRGEIMDEDKRLAQLLNQAEHAAADELVECECCFGDYPWEEVVACNEGHFFCQTCLNQAVKEIAYGQGSNLRLDKLAVKCMSSTADPPCASSISENSLQAGLSSDLFRTLEDRVSEDCLQRSGLTVIRCPFCRYAEVDESRPYRVNLKFAALILPLVLALLRWNLPAIFITISFIFTLQVLADTKLGGSSILTLVSLRTQLNKAAHRKQRRERGQIFKCKNTRDDCLRTSCQVCLKEWDAFHKCYEEEEDGLRIYIERAMAEAVKRTCPVCGLSFIKSDGCNKLICPCGYVMCYICRADIKSAGYRHFCQHFRQIPGTACSECDRCDLYLQEDESRIIKLAASRAEKEYLERDNRVPGWQPSNRQIAGISLGSQGSAIDRWFGENGPLRSIGDIINFLTRLTEAILDSLVEFEDEVR